MGRPFSWAPISAMRSTGRSHARASVAGVASRSMLVKATPPSPHRRDVVPAGIEQAGGTIHHFGMPVDPGNLLLFGTIGEKPVIGLPGCARSTKFNGLDQVLQRLLAGMATKLGTCFGAGAR